MLVYVLYRWALHLSFVLMFSRRMNILGFPRVHVVLWGGTVDYAHGSSLVLPVACLRCVQFRYRPSWLINCYIAIFSCIKFIGSLCRI